MKPIIKIAQEYVNTIEALFDRDPSLLSDDDYLFYLDCWGHPNLLLTKAKLIEEYLLYNNQL